MRLALQWQPGGMKNSPRNCNRPRVGGGGAPLLSRSRSAPRARRGWRSSMNTRSRRGASERLRRTVRARNLQLAPNRSPPWRAPRMTASPRRRMARGRGVLPVASIGTDSTLAATLAASDTTLRSRTTCTPSPSTEASGDPEPGARQRAHSHNGTVPVGDGLAQGPVGSPPIAWEAALPVTELRGNHRKCS
jgi:hypothetical protein